MPAASPPGPSVNGCLRTVLLVLLAAPLLCDAYTLEPSVSTLRSVGSDTGTFFRLQNRERRPAAVEISIQEHRKDQDGVTVTGPPADDSFVIYPQQVVMVPGDEVSVQVRWIGDGTLQAERAYTLVTREVAIPPGFAPPQDTSGYRVQVTVLLNYEARIYVAPPRARPNVVVESVAELRSDAPDAVSAPQLEVILANQGAAHQDLSELSFILTPVDASDRPLSRNALRVPALGLPGTGPHLLAGDRRRVKIPRPGTFPAGPVHVQVSR